MRPRFSGLWRHTDFLKLWSGQTISTFGSMVGGAALSFTAILYLHATPFQMGVLAAAGLLPGFLFGLAAGAWVDRLRRRPVLIGADIGRALALGSIPLAALFDVLRMEQLYGVAVVTGSLTVFFDVAYLSYLPSLLRSDQLLEGNSKLAASNAAAEAGGFSIAGWLVQALSGPVVILVDAVSFVASAAGVAAIRRPEPAPPPAEQREALWREMAEGLRTVAGHPLLRPLALSAVMLETFMQFIGAVIVLFMVRGLGFAPGVLGVIWAVGGLTSIAGSASAGIVTRRLGIGPAMVISLLFTGLGTLFVALAGGPAVVVGFCLVANQLLTDPAWTVYEVTQVSLRQSVAPQRLLGRVNGSVRFASLGAMLAATLVAGSLGSVIGLRATLVIGVIGVWTAALPLLLSPMRSLRQAPPHPSLAPAPAGPGA